jgi:hypothetical protein
LCGGVDPLRPQTGDVYRAFPVIAPDSATFERVRRLVAQFDELEPAARDAASRQLNETGRAGVLAASRIDRADLSAEQALRLDAFVSRNSTRSDVSTVAREPLFLCDCLVDDDRAVRTAALERLREVAGRPVEFDLDGSPATRSDAATTLAGQLLSRDQK